MTNLKILIRKNNLYRFQVKMALHIAGSAILLLLSLVYFNYSDFDIYLQNFLFVNNSWIIDKDEPIKKIIFYKLPKVLFGCAIVFCLVKSIIEYRKKSKNFHIFFLTFLGFSLIPLIAGNVKKFTNIYCPNQLEIYGESKPYVHILEKYPPDFVQKNKGKCFPAGHAITGFALFILFFSLQGKARISGFFGALFLGWVLGFYQMAKGAHFFSDTWIAMLLCFLLAAVISRVYNGFIYARHP